MYLIRKLTDAESTHMYRFRARRQSAVLTSGHQKGPERNVYDFHCDDKYSVNWTPVGLTGPDATFGLLNLLEKHLSTLVLKWINVLSGQKTSKRETFYTWHQPGICIWISINTK